MILSQLPHSRVPVLPALMLGFVVAKAGLAQEDVPKLSLAVKETIVVNDQRRAPIMEPVRCDSDGNVYFRAYQPPRLLASPVVKVSSDGKTVTHFSLASAPGFTKDAPFATFTISPKGEVFILAFRDKQTLDLVAFRNTGEFDYDARLESRFLPAQFAVFPTGELLVTGTEIPPQEGQEPERAFTALFDRNGKFLTKVSLPDDISLKAPAMSRQPAGSTQQAGSSLATRARTATTTQEDDRARPISLGRTEVGDDGNIYVVRAAAKPLVYVLSPDGEVVRRLELTPPSPKDKPWTFKVGGGMIAAEWTRASAGVDRDASGISLYDEMTGERQTDYALPAEWGGALACYSANGFTFVTARHGQLALLHAAPR
jgi:hypothetical protein